MAYSGSLVCLVSTSVPSWNYLHYVTAEMPTVALVMLLQVFSESFWLCHCALNTALAQNKGFRHSAITK